MNAKKIMLLAAFAVTTGLTVKAQTADEILGKHIEAMGGLDNWNKVKSLKLTGTVGAGSGMEVGITQTVLNKKAMRADMSVMGMSGYQILTDKGGWAYMPFAPGGDKVTELSAEQVKGEIEKLDVKNMLFLDKSTLSKMEYLGKDTIKGAACYKMKVTDKTGNEQTIFLDASNYFLVRLEMTVKAMGQEQEVAMNFSNFQKQPEGVVYPMTWGTPQGDLVYKTIEINKPIDESVFKPAEPTAAPDTKK